MKGERHRLHRFHHACIGLEVDTQIFDLEKDLSDFLLVRWDICDSH